jgi:quinolinate synthase
MFWGYVEKITQRKNMFIRAGECHVHAGIKSDDINSVLKKYRQADFLVHPECSCTSSTMYHMAMGDLQKTGYILSTEGMITANSTNIVGKTKQMQKDLAFAKK